MSEREKVVYWDMDGTMYDFDKAAVAPVPAEERVPHGTFYLTDNYPEYRENIEATYNHPDFFRNLELVPGVLETWEAIYQSGRQSRVLSAPLSSNEQSIEGKIASLRRDFVPHFGEKVIEEAIFDKSKWKYPAIAIFEDRPVLERGPEGLDLNPWEHIFVEWKYDRLVVPMTTAAYRLLDFSNPAMVVDLLDRIEFSQK